MKWGLPLSSYAIVERVYIDGQKYFDRLDEQKRLADLARDEASLVNAERSERNPTETSEASDAARPRPEVGPRFSGAGADVNGTSKELCPTDRKRRHTERPEPPEPV